MDFPASWYKDGQQVEESESLVVKMDGRKHRLILPEAQVQDSGEFECRTEGISAFFSVTVQGQGLRQPRLPQSRLTQGAVPILPHPLLCPLEGPFQGGPRGPGDMFADHAAPTPPSSTLGPHIPSAGRDVRGPQINEGQGRWELAFVRHLLAKPCAGYLKCTLSFNIQGYMRASISPLMDEVAETQRGYASCSQSHSQQLRYLGSHPGLLIPRRRRSGSKESFRCSGPEVLGSQSMFWLLQRLISGNLLLVHSLSPPPPQPQASRARISRTKL